MAPPQAITLKEASNITITAADGPTERALNLFRYLGIVVRADSMGADTIARAAQMLGDYRTLDRKAGRDDPAAD